MTNTTPVKQLLRVAAVKKSFGAENVLESVSFALERGRILGLVGENGAGKSTLARCISGKLQIDGGQIDLTGTVYTVPQEFMLIPQLSVSDNIFLGGELTRHGLLDHAAQRREALELFARLGCEVDPDAETGTLGVAARQMIELARALKQHADLLIMDEPTTVLSHAETERLFALLRDFRAGGGGVIYISHKLDEVRELCDDIAVLRDGKLVSHEPAAATDSAELASRMAGRPLTRLFPPFTAVKDEAPTVLEVENLSSGKAVKGVSFTLRRGEILGVAGLAGAGRTELAETICALRRAEGGKILIDGKTHKFRSPRAAAACGIVYLPEDRQNTAILADFSVEDNLVSASLPKYCQSCGFIDFAACRRSAERFIAAFHIKCSNAAEKLRFLSGGNQQKVAIAKYLDVEPRIFIFDEPTRGVDVGARGEIYEFIHSLAERGLGCVLISSDLEELIGNCRRIMVMREGEKSGELSGDAIDSTKLMYLATGVNNHEV